MSIPNNVDKPDWLRNFTKNASPEQFTAAFTAGALSILLKAGQPATVKALRRVKRFQHGNTRGIETVAHRIKHNVELPEQVRLAPDVILRVAEVRYWIEKNDARNAAMETARLFGVVGRSNDIDAEPYRKAGKVALVARSKGTAQGKSKADTRAELLVAIRAEVVAANPKAKYPELCDRIAAIARERHPDMFRNPPGWRTISRALQRITSGK